MIPAEEIFLSPAQLLLSPFWLSLVTAKTIARPFPFKCATHEYPQHYLHVNSAAVFIVTIKGTAT